MRIVQEIREKINLGLKDDRYFTALVLILVAVAAFGLGQRSAGEHQALSGASLDLPARHGSEQTAASAAAAATASSSTYYVASRNGQVYHLPYCSGAARISEQNKIIFKTKAEAEAAGYRPAQNCQGI